FLVACNQLHSTPEKSPSPHQTNPQSFQSFYQNLRSEAQQKGLNVQLLDASFPNGIQPLESVVKASKSQPEFTRTFASYVGPMLSANRVRLAQQHFNAHRHQLAKIQAETGVSASVLVALWGIETSFGQNTGNIPTIPALATLAWQSNRPAYFRAETFAALEVLEKKNFSPTELKGSWAGAMGQCQFMPSNYLKYGRDGSGDGVADIWRNEDDVFASSAAFLQALGWQKNQPWRHLLTNTSTHNILQLNSRGLSQPLTTAQLKTAKIVVPHGAGQGPWRYYHPQAGGPAYLLGPNFDVLLKWNNSSYFAYAVLALAESIEPAPTNR
ncbi:MAG: lytic murein transglycosylase, partial [Proteobacteria bacterium]|nr:lytic murein transglycosylase [Pseudomonadota bacterium]